MAKDKITVTIDVELKHQLDDDTSRTGESRSEFVETAVRNEHYRRLLARTELVPNAPAVDEDFTRRVIDIQHGRQPGGSA